MTSTLVRHLNSVLSRGQGYEHTPCGRHLAGDGGVAGYYIDFSAKTRAATASTPEVLLPAALGQLALGWWERSLDGDPEDLQRFREVCALLEARGVEGPGDALLFPYDAAQPKYRIGTPWISALAQAQAASVFVRAATRAGEDRYAELARRSIVPLVQRSAPTVVADTPHGPALEETPSTPPSMILNGWVYATWGLRDVAVALDDPTARQMLEATTETLVATLPRYDIGWWSRYSLYPHRLPDLAKLFYHRLHVDQLTVLERLTGERAFGDAARRWAAYDVPWRRARLVVQKASFVASGYR